MAIKPNRIGLGEYHDQELIAELETRGSLAKIEIKSKLEAIDKLIVGAGEYHDDPYEYVIPIRHAKEYYQSLKSLDLAEPIFKEKCHICGLTLCNCKKGGVIK